MTAGPACTSLDPSSTIYGQKKKKLFTDTLNPQPIFFQQEVGRTSSNNCAFSYGGFKKIKKT